MQLLKIYIASLFLILSFTNVGQAQDWVRQHPFDVLSRLYDIAITSEGFGWAVGTDCSILYTENNGTTWQLQETPDTEYPLRSIAYVEGSNGQKAFAGGNIFYRTDNGGETWKQVLTGISLLTILDIDVLSTDIIIISASGGMARSDDGGDTWTELGDFSEVLNASHWTDIQTGYTITSEKIYKTTDAGVTWDSIFGAPDQFFHTIQFTDTNTGYLQGTNNTFKTTDAGLNWTVVNTEPLPFNSNDFHLLNENELYVSYNNGGTLGAKSTDGGQTWIPLSTDNFVGRSYGVFANENGLWIGGALARIGYSSDEGANFIDQVPGNKNTITRCRFLNDQVGYVVGDRGTLLKTVDGGQIWEEKPIAGGINEYIRDVAVLDENQIWVTGFDELYRSEDGGDTWTSIMTDPNPALIYALSENALIQVSVNGTIKRSTDRGDTWTNVLENYAFSPVDIEFTNSQVGWVTGAGGQLLKTTDAGVTWTPMNSPTSNNLGGIQFPSENVGYLTPTSYGDTLWKTTDAGNSWTPVLTDIKTFWRTIAFQDENTGWIIGGSSSNGRIYKTIDGGQTWERSHSDVVSFSDGAIPVAGEATLWAVGFGGNIMKLAPCTNIPNLTMLNGPSTVCEGDTISYEVIGNDVAQYNWEVPSDWLIFGNSNSSLIQVIVGLENGQITIQGSNTCENSNTLNVDVSAIPRPTKPVISFDGVTLSTSSIMADSYQWYRGNTPSSSNAIFTPTISGIYTLVVTIDGCTSRPSEPIDVIVTSTQEVTVAPLTIYPNPGKDLFQIQHITLSPETTITLNDISGKTVYHMPLEQQSLNLGSLNSGLYLVQINTKDKIYIGKLLVLK